MQQFKQGEMEYEVLNSVEKIIRKHTDDYKCFIAKRSAVNASQYNATIAVIVDIEKSLKILKELALLIPVIKFSHSEVNASDERGVDILEFGFLCEIFDESVAECEEDEFNDIQKEFLNADIELNLKE